ncbi:MAG: flagellar biosynthetic protein FliO [Desulfocapsaceae bacterium]|jgi:flagellar protein FliO/FliZ|nr:flagellar biosynthetic protein FliO [Desulfocapsaceae bacterium]
MKKHGSIVFCAIPALLLYQSAFPHLACAAENFSLLGSSLKMIWGLLVVLGILLIIYGLVKKRMTLLQGGGKGIIKVIESRHLMPKKSLFLVEVRGREYLLGSGADSLNLIASLDGTDQHSADFKTVLDDTRTGISA